MNKSLLVAIAAAVAAVGIWLGIQSRQGPETLEPVVETTPEPEVEELLAEPEPVEPEVAEPETTDPEVEEMTQDILGEDAAETASEEAVEDAADVAEQELSPEAADEAADAIEEALEVQDLGLDLSVDAIRAQIEAAGLSLADRGIIEGLLQAAGDNPELLQTVVERLREMTGN